MMPYFLSCDWGTSNFRLRLVKTGSAEIVAHLGVAEGISQVFNDWKSSGADRVPFYLNILDGHLRALEERAGISLHDAPLIISGMASSAIGIMDIPYASVPFAADGSSAQYIILPKTATFPRDAIIVSGVRTAGDVMRGEETQVIGCPQKSPQGLIILPGTHSKHVSVSEDQVTGIKTFMTGELFGLLAAKSLLAASVEHSAFNEKAFIAGVYKGKAENLMNAIFSVRTNVLFEKMGAAQNYHYLSGVLIGNELGAIDASGADDIAVIAGDALSRLYALALSLLLPRSVVNVFSGDEAVVLGHQQLLSVILPR